MVGVVVVVVVVVVVGVGVVVVVVGVVVAVVVVVHVGNKVPMNFEDILDVIQDKQDRPSRKFRLVGL